MPPSTRLNPLTTHTEAMLSEISESFWLLISSDALLGASQHQVLCMVLNRTAPSGVLVAVDVNWQPRHWGLPPEALPTEEVLRRFQPLAEAFFFSRDPRRIYERLTHRGRAGEKPGHLPGRSTKLSVPPGTGSSANAGGVDRARARPSA